MSPRERFLCMEYDAAKQLTFHVDDFRDRFVKFFLSFSGLGGAAFLVIISKDTGSRIFAVPEWAIASLMMMIGILGGIVTRVLARLRSVQLEHFRIINNIRAHFLAEDYPLWNLVELSSRTLPTPNRKSGSYAWTLIVMVASAFFTAIALYLFVGNIGSKSFQKLDLIFSLFGFLAVLTGLDFYYIRAAMPRHHEPYEQDNTPQSNADRRDK